MSSVFGLNVRPRMPMTLPATSPASAATTFPAIACLRAALTRMVVSTNRSGAFASLAV